jgi:hypothetical protein
MCPSTVSHRHNRVRRRFLSKCGCALLAVGLATALINLIIAVVNHLQSVIMLITWFMWLLHHFLG